MAYKKPKWLHEKPKYTHDCENCVFLGRYDGQDLYACDQGGSMPTVIARSSSEPSDYACGLIFIDRNEHLREAASRAIHLLVYNRRKERGQEV